MIFGITGGSGSGKSHIVKYLKEKIPKSKLSFINQDNYYKRQNQIKMKKVSIILICQHPSKMEN